MMIKNLLYFFKVFLRIGSIQEFCDHREVTSSYCKDTFCPECGALVDVVWQVAKCSCCDTKRKTVKLWNAIVPETKYCKNCGSDQYYIDEIEIASFNDFKYAILNKVIINQEELVREHQSVQAWCTSYQTEPSKERKLVPVLVS